MTRFTIFRLAAALLLLLTAGEVVACEMFSPSRCEEIGAPGPASDETADDACICCCRHIVVARPAPVMVVFGAVTSVAPVEAPKPETASFPIYHPPKA